MADMASVDSGFAINRVMYGVANRPSIGRIGPAELRQATTGALFVRGGRARLPQK
jgi:hypothetical protein